MVRRGKWCTGILAPAREYAGRAPARLTPLREHREYTHTRERYPYTGEAVEVSEKRRENRGHSRCARRETTNTPATGEP